MPISIDFLKEDGTTISRTSTLAASSRVTIRADDVTGLESHGVFDGRDVAPRD